MTEIADLLERVKAATGPDRELEIAVLSYLGVPGAWVNDPLVERGMKPLPITGSIDALLALVERVKPGFRAGFLPGWTGNGKTYGGVITPVNLPVDLLRDTIAGGATPALAILAALLASMKETSDGQ